MFTEPKGRKNDGKEIRTPFPAVRIPPETCTPFPILANVRIPVAFAPGIDPVAFAEADCEGDVYLTTRACTCCAVGVPVTAVTTKLSETVGWLGVMVTVAVTVEPVM